MAAITRLSAFGYGTRRNGTFLRPVAPAAPGSGERAFIALSEGVVTRISVTDGAVTVATAANALVTNATVMSEG